MIFAALPDYGDNLLKVQLTSPWVESIKAAIKTMHSAGILHNDLHLRNFVGNAPNSVKLVDFAWSDSATSEHSCQAMEREEKEFMATLSVQVSLASGSLAIYLQKPSIVSTESVYCCWTADEMCVLQPLPISCHVCHLCVRAIASLHHVSQLC